MIIMILIIIIMIMIITIKSTAGPHPCTSDSPLRPESTCAVRSAQTLSDCYSKHT